VPIKSEAYVCCLDCRLRIVIPTGREPSVGESYVLGGICQPADNKNNSISAGTVQFCAIPDRARPETEMCYNENDD